MTEKVVNYLNELEAEKEICILLACETGSRAWGFPSPDSDYDVRILYVHKTDWYLSVNKQRDSIELMLENNDIDIAGWELQKSLGLLLRSNPALLERIQSPIIYKEDAAFVQDITDLAKQCYSKIATIHHYASMAKKIREELDPEKPYKLKGFFYALRSSVLCKWILEKTDLPPIVFEQAYRNLNLDPKLIARIDELIAFKAEQSESYMHTGEHALLQLIDDCLDKAAQAKDNLPSGNAAMEDLNALLRTYIHRYDH